jgi:glycosyltransferase involved in cell wall biosynthesis
MLRILTFGRFADADFGGLERYVFELSRALLGSAEFINIVASRGPAPDTAVNGRVVHARSIGSLGGVPICLGMPRHARRLHRERPFDIVHLQFPADPMAHAAATLLPRSVGRVVTWHGDIVRQKALLALYRPFLNQLLRSADGVILPTPAHLTSSRLLGAIEDRARFHVVPFGTDLARFQRPHPAAEAIRRRLGGPYLVFALGRHVYYKGFEYLIRALPALPDAQLVLGGRGPLTRELERLAQELGVRSRVDFAGRIPESELPAYYQACDVFCMPSVEPAEGFGFVQVEAMAAGRPVVCCELHNGVTYVNRDGETGLVVPRADPEALAAALRRLGGDSALRARLGAQAQKRVMGEFTLEAMARGTLEVYEKVLRRR